MMQTFFDSSHSKPASLSSMLSLPESHRMKDNAVTPLYDSQMLQGKSLLKEMTSYNFFKFCSRPNRFLVAPDKDWGSQPN